MLSFACPSCQKKLSVTEEAAGKQAKCPGCGLLVTVPQPAAAVPTSQARPRAASRAEAKSIPARATTGAETGTPMPKHRPQAGKESVADSGGQTSRNAGRSGPAGQAAAGAGVARELYDFLAPGQQPDEIGRLGPFRVLSVLGAGGMGVVYKAEDPQLKRLVALKAMLPSLAASPASRQRFLREAQAAATIVHEHVVAIYQVGEDRGVPFMAMQLLEGEPLDERLKRESRMPAAAILRIGREVAEGLAAAHEKGLIHRDIKPANIWLEGKKGRVKILDFGLARGTGGEDLHLTKTGSFVGTPAYMAPEQARSETVDFRCDLFSLGAVLYRMMTGELPFKGHDTMSLLMALALDAPRPPVELNFDGPQALSDLVMQLLAKDPTERPASAQAVADTLEQMQAAGPPAEEGADWANVLGDTFADRDGPISQRLVRSGRNLVAKDEVAKMKEEEERQRSGTALLPSPSSFWRQKPIILVGGGAAGLAVLVILLVFLFRSKDKEPGKEPQPVKDNQTIVKKVEPLPTKYKNGLGMEFVLVPKGKSWLGGGGGNAGDKEVEIKQEFYLGKYEVTQEEWHKVTSNSPSRFKVVPGLTTEELKRFPVESVSWDDIQPFLRLLNAQEKEAGWVYRLPKETEWEYACRGGPMTDQSEGIFYFYLDQPTNQLFSGQVSYNRAPPRTSKVGIHKPNRLGLYDMHGNVWEWCDDIARAEDGAMRRVIRGGCYSDNAFFCRAATRQLHPPGLRSLTVGLRLARVPSGKEGK